MSGTDSDPAGDLAIDLHGIRIWTPERIDILRGIDWSVRRGEQWALLGPNGSGKSTLLSVAGAWRHPSAGEATVLGGRFGRTDMQTLRTKIGVVDASQKVLGWLTVEEVALTGATSTLRPLWDRYGEAERARAREMLDLVGVAGLADRPISTCSQGERQRARIARALMTEPEVTTMPGAKAGSFPRRTPRVNPPPPAQTPIDAMVVITDAAAAAVGNPQAFIQLAIAEANAGYRNSGVPINLRLAGWYTTSYATVDFDTDLDRFTEQGDGFLDEFHARRNEIAADVNVLLIRDPAYQYCGLGWLNASAAYAFSVTDHRCATGNYTFAHEIGHNQGAHHDPANSTNTYFSYGHGYQQPAHGWRTIMAYACGSGQSCPRINAWSTPLRYRDRVPMGNRNQSDNARVLTETRTVVAGFR